jgi:UDP-glucose:(heptosyl)LPS alpha-1,3-glucosyltransferase
MRQQLGLPDKALAVLFVGSGWERKGLRFAIGAAQAAEIPELRLLVAGRGDWRRFRSPIAQFVGEVREVAPLYAAADIFVLPTIYDPFSNASLEALASGLPVITTRANGFAEIMRENVDGSVIDQPDDLAALTDALRIWASEEQRWSTRAARLELARRYDMATNISKTLEVLLQLAGRASI